MQMRHLLSATLLAITMCTAPVGAGPFRDAEMRIASAYADYRIALYQTNMRNRAATEAAMARFDTQWTALVADWRRTPPPQYADDPLLTTTLERVGGIIDASRAAIAAGDLARAHVVLEDIRDVLWRLRARNDIIVFSDRMNAYHEYMEKVIDDTYAGFSPDGLAALREDVGALLFLARDIAANPPRDASRSQFDPASQALLRSVEELRDAARRGDIDAIRNARDALKPPYSRMMQRFG